ncbi:hypothetical protein RQP46_006479 [Phenoliferia psychrophenolica]
MTTYTVRDRYPLYLGGKDVAGQGEPAGQAAFDSGVWSRMAPADRASIMSAIARGLAARVSELAVLESMQTGRPLREMRTQLGRLPEWFEYFSALCRTEEGSVQPTRGSLLNYVRREPLGVVALITSFNHPLLISTKKLAPALAAGNSVVLKPSEVLPDGVLSVLPGLGAITGKALVEDPRIQKVDVTGGTPGGRIIASIAGGNLASVTAELGGKAPICVFANVDLELAVNGVAFASFIASGQTCVAGTRILVQRPIFENFIKALQKKSESIERRMGSPFHAGSMMGPLISARQLGVVEELVEAARADGVEVRCGGKRMSGLSPLDGHDLSTGFFYPPTIIADGPSTLVTSTRIWREEAFGPVICVVAFDTEQDAIRMANDSEFGLGSAVWTRDGAQAIRVANQLECGLVWINTHHRNDPSSAWGGFKNSGIGRENGVEAFHSYSKTKSVIVNYAPEEESRAMDDWFNDAGVEARYG